ncbi:MAG: hypothetical protein NVS9B14_03450 [Candidatus Acidiferrum sp.]
MPGDERAIEKLKKAYLVLDVPEMASALAIKSNYRKLIKRWHPDRPATQAATAAEATTMTKLINEAYALIENAPLRYYAGEATKRPESAPTNAVTAVKTSKQRPRSVNAVDLSQMFFNEKRIEYAVRIFCGVIAGACVGLSISADLFRTAPEILAGIALGAVGFAAGAVKYGDRFWRIVFGKWFEWE